MANWGLLGALGEGVRSGVESYRTERDYQTKKALEEQDRKLKDRMYQADLMNKGLLESPEGGGLIRSPETLREQEAKIRNLEAQAAEHEANASGAGPKAQERELRGLQIQKARQELGPGGGVRLPVDKVLNMKEGETIPDELEDIKKVIDQNQDIMGPIEGTARSYNKYDRRAMAFDSKLRTASQAFGRYMEGGVLRKEDEIKYRKMFPELGDTPESASDKLANVERLLKKKQNSSVAGLGDAGYSTSGLKTYDDIPELPESLYSKTKEVPVGLVGQGDGRRGLVRGGSSVAKPSGPKAGQEMDGYIFLGGDPADKASWRKK